MRLESKDERIAKKSNELCRPLYPLIVILSVASAVLKYFFLTQSFSDFILELIAIPVSVGYLIFRSLQTGIPMFKNSDECTYELQSRYYTHSFFICFVIYLFGEFILLFVFDKIAVTSTYIAIWFIPSLIYTVQVVRKGLFVWGSQKAEKAGTKAFRNRVIIGSIFFGIIMEWKSLFDNGSFQPKGFLAIVVMSVSWGIPFYFLMKAMMKLSEKHSNKELKEADNERNVDPL